jgi:hypothetical protein
MSGEDATLSSLSPSQLSSSLLSSLLSPPLSSSSYRGLTMRMKWAVKMLPYRHYHHHNYHHHHYYHHYYHHHYHHHHIEGWLWEWNERWRCYFTIEFPYFYYMYINIYIYVHIYTHFFIFIYIYIYIYIHTRRGSDYEDEMSGEDAASLLDSVGLTLAQLLVKDFYKVYCMFNAYAISAEFVCLS